MNLKTLLKSLFTTGLLLGAMSQTAIAKDAVLPVSLNIYPLSITVPLGSNEKLVQATFYVVSNVDAEQKLTNFKLNTFTHVNPTPGRKVTFTDNCGGVLKSQKVGGTCTITLSLLTVGNAKGATSFIPNIIHSFSFDYGNPGRMQTMTSPQFPAHFATGQEQTANNRTFHFTNNCSVPVWLGISSGAVDAITPNPAIHPADAKSCLTDADCYDGSTCNTVSPGLKHCLWNNPVPTGGAAGYELTAFTGTATVDFPVYDNGIDTQWNGGIAARLGCASSGTLDCKIADCGGTATSQGCVVPTGFQTPNTTAEFTLLGIQSLVTNVSGYPDKDTYDITLINGMVGGGLSMAPSNAPAWSASAPYICGTPGNPTALTPLGACDWAASPPAAPLDVNGHTTYQADYQWVATGGSEACPHVENTNGGCTLPEMCGRTITGGAVSSTYQCGSLLGLLSADAICAKDSAFGSPFDCTSTVTIDTVSYTYAEIYGCSTGIYNNSCYSKGATSDCCGCQNWQTAATFPAVIPSTTQGCRAFNTNWQDIAEPSLSWIKQACPTAYVFPYDDASSTFNCQVLNGSNVNTTDYQITFCPGA